MLALLALLAAVSPEPLPAPPAPSPPARIVRVVEVRLSSLETTLRADAPPGRFRDLAKTLVVRARVRLAAGDAAAADQLGAAATDILRAEQPLVIILQMPPGAASAADRAARHLDHVGAMLAMTAGFAERGDAATLLGLARAALGDARKALAADDARSAEGGARRAETLARAALHAAIADDPGLKVLQSMPPLPHRPPLPVVVPVPPGELP